MLPCGAPGSLNFFSFEVSKILASFVEDFVANGTKSSIRIWLDAKQQVLFNGSYHLVRHSAVFCRVAPTSRALADRVDDF